MSSDTLKIARRVMRRVAVDQGTFGLSTEGFDMAEASAFIDEANISLNLALACEIAAKAEEAIENGETYVAKVTIEVPGMYFNETRAKALLDQGGLQATYDEISSSTLLKAAWRRTTRSYWRSIYKDFANGIMPTKPGEIRRVTDAVKETYLNAKFPTLNQVLYDVDMVAIGLLREMGLEVGRNQLKVDYFNRYTSGPWFTEISLDDEVFFREDVLQIDPKVLRSPASFPGETYLRSMGDEVFRHPFLGSQDTMKAADALQQFHGGLTHPLESVRLEALEWLSHSAEAQLFRYMIYDNKPSADVKAAARGLIKRIIKDYDNATFDETRTRAAEKFFGKDLKMLLAKCWNKSDFKQNFGAFDLSPRMKELFLQALGRRLNPLMRSKDDLAKFKVNAITDLVMLVLMECALRKIAPQAKFDYEQLFRYRR